MKANEAYCKSIELEATCLSVSEREWNKLMKGAKKASGLKIRAMIKRQLPDLYESLALSFRNPYEHQSQRTDTHLIYVHSGIEYFLRMY